MHKTFDKTLVQSRNYEYKKKYTHRRASSMYSWNNSAARWNDGTAGALTIALVIPVSATTGGGTANRPGLTSVDIGECDGSETFTLKKHAVSPIAHTHVKRNSPLRFR